MVICTSLWPFFSVLADLAKLLLPKILLAMSSNSNLALIDSAALFQRYQTQAGQKTQDERLSLLLESLKPLCTLEEFEGYREEAFTQLQGSGFRQAREFAVKTHEQLRERLKKSTEQTSPEDLEDTA